MEALSLFSGAGGMDFGAERVGLHIKWANDLLPEACETYQRYFPDSTVVDGDISLVRKFPKADLVIGGYPCQSFSLGGNRNPAEDKRTNLYREYARVVEATNPAYFLAENVGGLKGLNEGRWLSEQISHFRDLGKHGYTVSWALLKAEEYGVPQRRKRVFIVGVRKDLKAHFHFPMPTHAATKNVKKSGLLPFSSHGEVIKHLPLWPEGEFYERPHDPDGNFSWYFMSRNRKARWADPAFTVVANFRHITLHPASPVMKLTWSNLADGFKQRWDFSEEYEHLSIDPSLPILENPRRLSWRECALIQTFPQDWEPYGKLEKKFEQIGNAVPPRLASAVLGHLSSGLGICKLEDCQPDLGSASSPSNAGMQLELMP